MNQIERMENAVEAILFVSGEAVLVQDIAQALDIDKKLALSIIRRLSDAYETGSRGIRLTEINGAYQMCTAPEYFEYIEALGKTPKKKTLTQALLETLAIVAYKQPVTKTDIERIRGVNADHAINKLMEYGFVCEQGRADTPGRPVIFGTSDLFLKHFGIRSIDELPKLPEDTEKLKKEAEEELGVAETGFWAGGGITDA